MRWGGPSATMRVLRTRTITPESWARACPDSEYGLCTGIYADDEWELQEFLDRVEAGVCGANRRQGATTGAIVGAQPLGGWKS